MTKWYAELLKDLVELIILAFMFFVVIILYPVRLLEDKLEELNVKRCYKIWKNKK